MKNPKYLRHLYKEYRILIHRYDSATYTGIQHKATTIGERIELVKKQIKKEEERK